MALPIVIIFERHWDAIPKLLAKDLVPKLLKQGYDTFCLETPQGRSSDAIIRSIQWEVEDASELKLQAEDLLKRNGIVTHLSNMSFRKLAELMRQCVSSKHYEHVAEKIRSLDAIRVLAEALSETAKKPMNITGVDIDDFHEIFYTSDNSIRDMSERVAAIREKNGRREEVIFQNLLKLQARQKGGVIFISGTFHASGLLAKFKEQNRQDEVLFYFPHSSTRFDEEVDDIKLTQDRSAVLIGHTHLLKEQDTKPFAKRIVKEISNNTKYKYKEEIPSGNSHSQFLSQYFKTTFKTFLRPGYYVDALADFNNSSDAIQKRLNDVSVQTHDVSLNGRKYLVVPNVNTEEVGNKIRELSLLGE